MSEFGSVRHVIMGHVTAHVCTMAKCQVCISTVCFCVDVYVHKCHKQKRLHYIQQHSFLLIPTVCLYTHTHTHTRAHAHAHTHTESPLSSLPLSFWYPSLSVAMDCETHFYHYTLQVKKGSWECVIYAGLDFYVAYTGSSIIALPGTVVHRAPDEMLSWHCYQSPYACPSPVPDVQEGACVVVAGLPPSHSLPLSGTSVPVTPTLTVIRHLNGVFYSMCFCIWGLSLLRSLWQSSLPSQPYGS